MTYEDAYYARVFLADSFLRPGLLYSGSSPPPMPARGAVATNCPLLGSGKGRGGEGVEEKGRHTLTESEP